MDIFLFPLIHARSERGWTKITLVNGAHRSLSPYLAGRFPMFATFDAGSHKADTDPIYPGGHGEIAGLIPVSE
jgi:hypothetical protein